MQNLKNNLMLFFVVFSFVQENIAFLKPTNQSSTLMAFFSSNAVDGVKNSDMSYCTHTQGGGSTNPWWRVDLQSEQPVAEVRILNRGDCCADRLDGAEIRVGRSSFFMYIHFCSISSDDSFATNCDKTCKLYFFSFSLKGTCIMVSPVVFILCSL